MTDDASDRDRTAGGVVFRFSKVWYARALLLRTLGLNALAARDLPLAWVESDPRPLPGPQWVRVRTVAAGICGSDLGVLRASLSAQLSPFASFPAVLGHEGTGVIAEAGADSGWSPGTRVVVDPFLGCLVRGNPPCRSCAAGWAPLCEERTRGPIRPAMLLGTSPELPGTWGTELIAHRSQLHAVPASLSDDLAVLVEPLAISMHAVLASPPPPDAPVLVVGGGAIGLLVLAALKLAGHDNPVAVIARHPVQRRLAGDLGAAAVFDEANAAEGVAGFARGRVLPTLDGGWVLEGGAAVTYDAVPSGRGLDLALRLTRTDGVVSLVGSPGRVRALDVTGVWAKALTVRGALGYGAEGPRWSGRHTMDVAMELLAAAGDRSLERLITHRYPLARYREAVHAALGLAGSRPVKVVLVTRSSDESEPTLPGKVAS